MRPRERYAHRGPTSFGDIELLGLVVGTGTSTRSSAEVAAALVGRFGGLAGVAGASVAELQGLHGVGLASAVRIHAAMQLGRRSLVRPEAERAVTSVAEAVRRLQPPLTGLVDEELHGLYLDRRRRPVAQRMLTRGSDAFTVVDPRQIFRVAVQVGASGVILAHNHPSGDPTPSAQDHDVTERVAAAGRVLGIPLLDHLVVGDHGVVSLAERGQLPAWRPGPPGWTADSS